MTFNILQDLKQQGLLESRKYAGFVVDNNDPKGLCRIKVRVPVVFDGIKNEDLPWAIPHFNHVDGASNISGVQFVPKNNSKVWVIFQENSPTKPVWIGYHVDETTKLQEMEFNYPDRLVVRFQNKALVCLDTKANVAHIRWPGTLKLYIYGNVETEIIGNVEEHIHGNVNRLVDGNLTERVKGSKSCYVGVDYKQQVIGSKKLEIGNYEQHSNGKTSIYSTSSMYLESKDNLGLYGENIYEDYPEKGSPGNVVVTDNPNITVWDGIRGGSKGEN